MEFIYYLFEIAYFIVAAFLALYIPGRVILGKKKEFSNLALHTISLGTGIVMFAWQGFVFGTLGIRWATYVYIIGFIFFYFYKKYYPKKFSFALKNIDLPSFGIVTLGVFAQTISFVSMGWVTDKGVNIIAHNDVDHIWHATIVNELVKRYPPHEPGIAGVILKDYHYLFNLITADLIRVFHLALFPTQFIGMYGMGSILFGLLVFVLAQKINPSKLFIRLSLFILFFVGGAAGWYMLWTAHIFDWNVSSLIVDGTKLMDSPAYGYAIIAGFTGIYFLLQKKLSWMDALITALCFGSLLEFKVYVGIAFFVGFGCFALYGLLKKNIRLVAAFILAVICGIIIFLPGVSKGGGLAFIPFDIPRDFINQPKLGHVDWQLAWVIFQDHHNIPRIIQYGLMMSGIYFLIQFGILLLGVIPLRKTTRYFGTSLIFMYPAIVTSILMGLLFYQRVGGANIWEFFLAAVPLLGFLVAGNLTALLENRHKSLQFVILLAVIIFIIPQWVISTESYIEQEFFTPFHGISNAELDSFNYLYDKTPTNSLVLVLGQQKYVAYSSVISLFAQRDLYLSGEGVRQKKTAVINHREDVLHALRTTADQMQIANMLKKEQVNYLYVYNGSYPGIFGDQDHLVKQFSNQIATIYQVK